MNAILMSLWSGCNTASNKASEPLTVSPMGDAECAVCGMDLAGQPAPRAQAMYRDGSRRFACSIGDLRVLLQTPNPLGEPHGVWVEQDLVPTRQTRDEQPWIPAEQAWFVFGIERPEVMGIPALVFPDRPSAETVASELKTHAVPWKLVRETPFNQIPMETK